MKLLKILAAAGLGIAFGVAAMRYLESRDAGYPAEVWHNLE
ncbi:hypothetical protein [Lolliginicoccus suaedae]|nr:hypothetical protein [Lolliginicoccus suaedae]